MTAGDDVVLRRECVALALARAAARLADPELAATEVVDGDEVDALLGLPSGTAEALAEGGFLAEARVAPPWAESVVARLYSLGDVERLEREWDRSGAPVPFRALWRRRLPRRSAIAAVAMTTGSVERVLERFGERLAETASTEEGILALAEAARALGKSARTVRRMVERGELVECDRADDSTAGPGMRFEARRIAASANARSARRRSARREP